jgi:two-component system NtrC family response regulator
MVDMENKTRSLIAFVGMRDPYPEQDDEPGPLLALLLSAERDGGSFDELWLLCTGSRFLERARDLEREARDEGVRTRFYFIDFPVTDVIDYAEIWGLLERSLKSIQEQAGSLPRDWSFLLDSGTPQMKTTLFLASRSGVFPARLLQGIPPRFAGGAYKCREVKLDGMPEVLAPRSRAAERPDAPSERPMPKQAASPVQEGDEDIVASSRAFLEVLERALNIAKYDAPVLIVGETGTGKTMIARRIHGHSSRAKAPFVEVNCSAIAESLAESELFGHAKNAFTGAASARSGKFRAAHGGTLFLDEVGDLSPDIQAKLLKALEDGAVTPVGSDEPIVVDLRLVAATNRDLPEMIAAGKFRRDLYERLKVARLSIPPLRERREEILPMAERSINAWNERYGEKRYLTPEALSLLESYSWPGNVRELRNALLSAACSVRSDALGPEALPEEIRASGQRRSRSGSDRRAGEGEGEGAALPEGGINLKAKLLQQEWEYVSRALRAADGNRETAASLLGVTGHAFRKALRERLSAFIDEGKDDEM